MTLHKLHADNGYTYLTDSVAVGDRKLQKGQSLSDYYNGLDGTPQGQWWGAGAQLLGVSGGVTERQMIALYGEGINPNADEIMKRIIDNGGSEKEALQAVKLGRSFASMSRDRSPVLDAIAAGVHRAERDKGQDLTGEERQHVRMSIARESWEVAGKGDNPSNKELSAWVSELEARQTQPVAGYDLVFTPQKSVSVVWGLADKDGQEAILKAHSDAVDQALTWVESEAAYSRQGAQGSVCVEGQGLTVARYLHWDNRAGHPNLHTHSVVSNKVFCPLDGRWRALDGRAMYKIAVAASNYYNQALAQNLRHLGYEFEQTPSHSGKEPVWEIKGVPKELLERFSRRSDIEERTDELAKEYVAKHHRSPDQKTMYALFQRATLETRGAKQAHQNLDDMRAQWREIALGIVDEQTLKTAVTPQVSREIVAQPVDVSAVAEQVVSMLETKHNVFSTSHIVSATSQVMVGLDVGDERRQHDLIDAVCRMVVDQSCVEVNPGTNSDLDVLLHTRQRSLFHQSRQTSYTTSSTLWREQQLVDSAFTSTAQVLTRDDVNTAITEVENAEGRELNAGQRALVHRLLGSGRQLDVAIGPAGTGKTTAMKAVAQAWSKRGDVVALGPSAVAADVLGTDLGVQGNTIASVLTKHKHGLDTGITADSLIIVDEAGMASTHDLYQLNEIAKETGATIRLIGDPRQVNAVDAGGMLATLSRLVGARELEEVVRFTTPGEASNSLELRNGNAQALEFYRDNKRYAAGTRSSMVDALFNAWVDDTDNARSSLMIATARKEVAELNAAAQAHRIERGEVSATVSTTGRDNVSVHVGDLIVSRKNDATITIYGGEDAGRRIFNGDQWRVREINADGSITAIHTANNGRVVLPADYVKKSVELGYASTVHRAQGLTVDTAHMLIDANTSRELAYVGLTRGRQSNHVWLVTEDDSFRDFEHTPPQRAATPEQQEQAVWQKVMERSNADLSALDQLGAEPAPEALDERYEYIRDVLISASVAQIVPANVRELMGSDDDVRRTVVRLMSDSLDSGVALPADAEDPHQWITHARSVVPHTALTVGVLPAEVDDAHQGLLDWARHTREELCTRRAVANGRVAEIMGPFVGNDFTGASNATLEAGRRELSARARLAEDNQKLWENHARAFDQGDSHRAVMRTWSDVLALDARIRTVEQREADGLDTADLRKKLPVRSEWADIHNHAARARTEITRVIAAERRAYRDCLTRVNEARNEANSMRSVIASINDELAVREERGVELSTDLGTWREWVRPEATTPRAQRVEEAQRLADARLKPEDVRELITHSQQPETAIDEAISRLAHQITLTEKAVGAMSYPQANSNAAELVRLQQRRKELKARYNAMVNAEPDDATREMRARISQAQRLAPTLDREVRTAEAAYADAIRAQIQLPPEPGRFATPAKRRQWQETARIAQHRVDHAAQGVAHAKDERDALYRDLPPQDQWGSILTSGNTLEKQRDAAALQAEILRVEAQIRMTRSGGINTQQAQQHSAPAYVPHQQINREQGLEY
ncbi:MobF family relaxase [Corynebacterium sp. CCM 9203]|uniref:MobF family relaxase n=1 Tax=Corynebacterium sp. CCM 9203 TaxID=3057615 RepID=UPI003524FD40